MRYFPAFFDVKDRLVVIAGDGETAARKARLFAKAGARLRFLSDDESALAREEFAEAEFASMSTLSEALADAVLCVAATDDAELDARIAEAARAARVPVNVVDRPELCDFTVPSMIDRGDLVVGVSTGGAAPVFGRRLRRAIEALIPQRTGALLDLARSLRKTVAAALPDEAARRRFWERFFDGPAAAAALEGDEPAARRAALALLNADEAPAGVAHIVGAGPGDPELLTLKALRLLQDADVILYDSLVAPEILDLARRDAERIAVGKRRANHTMPQSEIGDLMIRLVKDGKRVVRLKGGDPYVFGRGGEEVDQLSAAGVPYTVTPGVTAATGCAAAANTPLTHRDVSQAVTFVTGHAKDDGEPGLDWSALAALRHTLVVYMGVARAQTIADRLIAAGRGPATPIAIIENGTRPDQRIIKGALADLGALSDAAAIKGPAALIIGEVAARADGQGLVAIALEGRSAA